MNVAGFGLSVHSASVELREKLAFNDALRDRCTNELSARFGAETVLLSTCNRVELYMARGDGEQLPEIGLIAEYFGEIHHIEPELISSHLVERQNQGLIAHLFRVAASLDSLIVGEGQIAGQVKDAFESAMRAGHTGPFLNALFQAAQRVAKRVRTETPIAEGHVSVSSVAVDFVCQVFDHFSDKNVLVIGAGKMGRLTLKHLQELAPKRILITNRSPEKAQLLADACNGTAVPWENLDEALTQADIILSTTGSPEVIVTKQRYAAVRAQRGRKTTVILDIAVPRDFDPAIHDAESTFLFNIDDLKAVREQAIARRRGYIDQAEAIVAQEVKQFEEDWSRRKSGPVIAELTKEFETKRQQILADLMPKLNGKLSDKERKDIEAAFRLFQNRLLHGPISVLSQSAREGNQNSLLDAIRKLFGLN
ncbi:MAG: glutamyl-tRNA reductase [Zavarzinella sp.]